MPQAPLPHVPSSPLAEPESLSISKFPPSSLTCNRNSPPLPYLTPLDFLVWLPTKPALQLDLSSVHHTLHLLVLECKPQGFVRESGFCGPIHSLKSFSAPIDEP
ncbi:hypothetical protein CRG98_016741 [Punica granatum]|uniref:Uncharacterized protein n=1 Tax=Punica granatum TaxID=22663 RepID=A0A2I0K2X5_PUNGR|nr:hypothetical protein CRG98_016741 [Punica granatum]